MPAEVRLVASLCIVSNPMSSSASSWGKLVLIIRSNSLGESDLSDLRELCFEKGYFGLVGATPGSLDPSSGGVKLT